MTNMLHDVLSRSEKELVDVVVQRLRCSGALNYQRLEETILLRRAEYLVESFLHSVKDRPTVFMNYIKEIAKERISEGFFLHEIQMALQILEEKAWQLVVEYVPLPEQVRCLSQITCIIGNAKDQLAHIYLQQLEKAELKTIPLRDKVNELAKGTDSGPVEEDDLNFGKRAY